MILGLCLIGVALLGWAVAVLAARPPAGEARRRDDDRRFRQVYQNPELVNLLDVENLLLADGVPADSVARVMHRAEARRITARTMWAWADRHGSVRLVDVLDAGLAEDTMLDHLDVGTTPEWRSIRVFADLANDTLPAGMPLDELIDLDAVPTLSELTFADELDDWTTHAAVEDEELAAFDSLPPIADPGFGPFSPDEALADAAAQCAATDEVEVVEGDAAEEALTHEEAAETQAVEERPKRREAGGDWPAVA